MDSIAMPVEAGVLSAVRHMMRINSRPLELQLSRSIVRVAMLSTVLRMVSINCRSTLASNSGDTT
eukprot:5878621-Pleurochrysis_carterae.AAC.2